MLTEHALDHRSQAIFDKSVGRNREMPKTTAREARGDFRQIVAQEGLAAAEADPRFLRVPTRLAVLRALVADARHSRQLVVHPGVRKVALAAGVGEGTVKRALADLVAWGYVSERKGARRSRKDAAEWRITPAAKVAHNSQRGQRTRTRGETPEVATDLWRYRYLGPRAHAIFRYIERYTEWEPDFTDIFQTVGAARDPRTVRKHLSVLISHGLIAETPEGFTLGPRSVEQVAASLGLAENPVTAAQRRRHATERAGYRDALTLAESRRRSLVPGYAVCGRSVGPVPDIPRLTTGIHALRTLANGRSALGPGWRGSAWLGTRPRLAPRCLRSPRLGSGPSAPRRRPHGPSVARPP